MAAHALRLAQQAVGVAAFTRPFPRRAHKRLIAWKHDCESDLPQGEPRRLGVKQGKELDEPPLAIGGQLVRRTRFLRRCQSEQCCVALGSLQTQRSARQDRHRERRCPAGRISAEEYAVPHAGDIHDEMASSVQFTVNDNVSAGRDQTVLGFVRCFENGRSCCEVGVPDCRAARWRLARIAGESSGPIARPGPPVLHRHCRDRH